VSMTRMRPLAGVIEPVSRADAGKSP
jgi:hypothetical protein